MRAYPRDGVEEEEEEDEDEDGSKDRVAKREDSVARTDDDAFSYSASSWMSARISGTSGLCLVAVYWLVWGGGIDSSGRWMGGLLNLPASVANRIIGEEAIMSV